MVDLTQLRKDANKAIRLTERCAPVLGDPGFNCKPEIVLQLLDIIEGKKSEEDTTITPERLAAMQSIVKEGLNLSNKAAKDLLKYVDDLIQCIEEKRRLTRELDVALNGRNAAKQAALIDVIGQIEAEGIRSKGYK